MKSLSKREKVLIIVMLACGLFYGYFSLFLKPILNEYSKLNSNINAYKIQLNYINAANLNNKKLENNLPDLEKKLNDAMKLLPSSERNPEISYNIKQFADKNKVIINEITFGKQSNYSEASQVSTGNSHEISKESSNNLMYLPATVTVSGDYTSIINFIASIENENRIAYINSVNFTVAGNTLQANINTNFYFVNGTMQDNYDFNKGSYGKDNLFK